MNKNIESVYPLSPMQQGMLFHSLYAPEAGAYFEQFSCILRGNLNTPAFEKAWQEVIRRQSVLRTAFVWKRLDRMLQVVQKEVNLPLELQDWRMGRQPLPPAQQEAKLAASFDARLQAFLAADRARGFDLAKAPLMRLNLFRIADDAHFFVWSHHHALLDGWSMPLLLKEVLAYYDAFSAGKSLYLPPARPYRDYINWLQAQDASDAQSFWQEMLKGMRAPTSLIVDRLIGEHQASRSAVGEVGVHNLESEIQLSTESTAELMTLARRERVTLNTLLQAAWAIVLSRYTGEEDVMFGATVAGRPAELPGAETMIGLFINTLPVRISTPPEANLVKWLQDFQAQVLETRQYEYSSLVQIQEWSEVPRGFPLFESILVFENYPVEETLKAQLGNGKGLAIEAIRSNEQTNYPLTIVSGPGNRLVIKASYDPNRFDEATINRLLGHIQTVLEGMVVGMNQPSFYQRRLLDLPLLTAEEEKLILDDFSGKSLQGYPADTPQSIVSLFEKQVLQSPDRIALIQDNPANGGPQEMTYVELNRRADILAGYLVQAGIGPDVLAGIFIERSLEMIVSILAVLKAGGAYLPLDPNYPPERIAYMLADSRTPVILTKQNLVDQIKFQSDGISAPRVVRLDTEWDQICSQSAAAETAAMPVEPDTLAYVIYTSGSTGKPKGVMIEHRSLANHAVNYADMAKLRPGDRVLQFISLSFDASAEEIFPALVSGATLVLSTAVKEMTTTDFCQMVERQAISVLHLPVAFWHQCVDDMTIDKLIIPANVRLLVVGGENPSVEKLKTWKNLAGESSHDLVFMNAYGPTEATITATIYQLSLASPVAPDKPGREWAPPIQPVPIGRNLPNVLVYLLDRQLRPTPIGVPGEICIGGAGVARGYLNQPELTAEKFIPNLFQFEKLESSNRETSNRLTHESSDRLYRTGDLGKFLPDGNIVFVGRVDQQVKIRGFRIELGEIETVLTQHPKIQSAAVLARDLAPRTSAATTSLSLVAYLVLEDPSLDHLALVDELRAYLSGNLPEFMVPAAFMVLETMPVTPNGKIDRQALPTPDGSHLQRSHDYVAPRSPVEALIAGVWEQVLGTAHVGVYDNFFDLGGHSLLATQVISRLRNVFQIDIPLRDLFESLTVAGLATQIEALLRAGNGLEQPSLERLPRAENAEVPLNAPPLSFSQQRLWFLDQLAPGNLFYNIPLAVEIDGNLDPDSLEKALNEIIARHAVLRTNFQTQDGTPVQVVRPELKLSLPAEDLTHLAEAERQVQAQKMAEEQTRQAFDLEHDPLIRARLLRLGENRHVFLLTMHHIVADGWSMGIFFKELAVLYSAYSNDKPSPLPQLKFQYFDYASGQRAWLQGEQLDRQLAYWKKQLANQPRILDLPTDHPRPPVQSSRGATQEFTIALETGEKLNELSRREGATLFMTLLAAFQVLLYRHSGQADISVGTAIANRNRSEIESMIGFFVNTLVIRTDLSGEPDFKELLKRVREVTLGAYAHQDLPFEMLVEALQPERDLSHTPLFQVAFALQNAPTTDAGFAQSRDSQAEEYPLDFHMIQVDTGSAKFDLTLSLAETPTGLVGSLEYNRDLFEPESIQRMIGHYRNLLEAIVAEAERTAATGKNRTGESQALRSSTSLSIDRLPLLTPAEQEMILVDWNASDLATPVGSCAHELFEARAQQNPDVEAIRFENTALTYRELDQRANILAQYLRNLGVGVSSDKVLVGLSTERSFDMIVGILAVMKAGGAYVPLDPSYPVDRLAYMLQDSQVPVLLTQMPLRDRLPLQTAGQDSAAPIVLCLDAEWEKIAGDTADPLASQPRDWQVSPDSLAYMIYTSGSTGKPKGTILRHRGLSNLAEAQRQAFTITPQSRVLQFSPLSFDASVWEIFMALANGATLVLARQETLASGPDLLRLLKEQSITTVTLPPSVLRLFSAEEVTNQALPALQTVISAGEACTPDLVANWSSGRSFINAYGPTETTVCASMYRCSRLETEPPPIGRPIANTRVYILDKHQQPVPVNVPGELHVSGISLAVGYRNQPELTAEKFIQNPFKVEKLAGVNLETSNLLTSESFKRLYRTGDLARYRADGNIEFLGRIDQQVKVRGFRIELGEIESALSNHPALKDVAVIAQDLAPADAISTAENSGSRGAGVQAEKRLVAFVVPEAEHAPEVSELRAFLRQTLPEYMVPSAFVFLAELPLSPSGKIDRKVLANMQAVERPDLESAYTAPRNQTEERLVQISSELLHLDRVGVYDNFFELGGHSLLATQFVSRVRDEFGIELPLRKLFENPTIAGIAAVIEEARIAENEQQAAGGETARASKAADRAKLLEMLQRIGDLSPDEVKALLELKRRSEE